MDRRLLLAALCLAAAPGLARAAAEEKKKTGGSSYIALKTLTGTTNKPGGRRGVMTVECGLEIPDGALRERAEKVLPRLRSAYVQTVISYAGGLPYGTAPNTDFLARTMQRQTDTILGKPGARFLLGSVLLN